MSATSFVMVHVADGVVDIVHTLSLSYAVSSIVLACALTRFSWVTTVQVYVVVVVICLCDGSPMLT